MNILSLFKTSRWLRTGCLLLGMSATALGTKAEGSKNLTPGTNTASATGANDYIGYLQTGDGGNSSNFLVPAASATQRLYVHLKTNDTLFYGIRRFDSGDAHTRLRLRVMENTTTAGQTTFLPVATGTNPNGALLAPGPGVIGAYAEAAVGPRYKALVSGQPTLPATGYNPLYYVNTGAERDVWVEFNQVDNTTTANATQNRSWYNIWDFTVRQNGEKPGRVYAHTWSFTGTSFAGAFATTFGLYPLIPNPNAVGGYASNESFFVKRINYAGITPFGLLVVANSQGTTVGATFKDKRKSQTTNVGYAEYKMFLNNPDPAIYPTTRAPGQPTVTTNCTGGTTTFTLTVDQAGFGVVFIDGNNNGTYEAAADRVLEQLTNIGNNDFVWDGKSDTGVAISATTISVNFSSGVGPVNFPLYDCESTGANGITVSNVRPGSNGAPDFIFYDDSNLPTGFSNPRVNPIGNNSPTNGHKWGVTGAGTGATSGDNVLVNTYAVGLIARGQSVNVTYNPATACATAPPVILLPVKLVSFEARAQASAVLLNWATASETNSAYFEVERSADGRRFEPLGRVEAQGSSSTGQRYSFSDTEPGTGTVYYRLHMLDRDGSGQYSAVRLVTSKAALTVAAAYPNPATSVLTVRLHEALVGPVTLRVLDATGRVVWQEQRQMLVAQRTLEVPTAQLPTGRSYLLQLQSSTGSVVQRFVK